MPILIQSESGAQSVSPVEFSSEQELELVLKEHPELLQDDNDADDGNATRVAFVASQLDLPEGAGTLDLLFVSMPNYPQLNWAYAVKTCSTVFIGRNSLLGCSGNSMNSCFL
jgi:hypothetical protein